MKRKCLKFLLLTMGVVSVLSVNGDCYAEKMAVNVNTKTTIVISNEKKL